MLSEYQALSILIYMKIFLSRTLSYMNDTLNTSIRRIYLQPFFHLAWYIQEEIALCICQTRIFQTYSRKHTQIYELSWTLEIFYQFYWLCHNQLKRE